jgi:hypothetical protein
MTLQEAIAYLLDEFHLGDYVYQVKERITEPFDGSLWDHPKVTKFSEAVKALETSRVLTVEQARKKLEMEPTDEIIPPSDPTSIPEGAKCQEASIFSQKIYIPCGAPAVAIIKNRDLNPYYMCFFCASHNIHNRGAKLLFTTLIDEDKAHLERSK